MIVFQNILTMSKFLLVILLTLSSFLSQAQVSDYAYIYIEGDKETPFYIKMEGKMQPRLGQHYAILPNLDGGVTNIEILFQQNKYAPIKFAVKVPNFGARGLQLRKIEDQFALYDIQTGHYILPGNKATDDDITALAQMYSRANKSINEANTKETQVTTAKAVEQSKNTALPAFNPGKSNTDEPKTKEEIKEKEQEQPKTVATPKETKPKDKPTKTKQPTLSGETEIPNLPKSDKSPTYIENVTINNNEDGETESSVADETGLPPNSDCKEAMSEAEFTTFLARLKEKEGENRIKFLNKYKRKCFTTEQVSYIGRSISSVSGRLQVLQQLYAQTTDQENYYMLESLFNTDFLKKKFKDSININ